MDLARFADRDDLRGRFHTLVHSVDESPVLMFYGAGGAGKSWLLKKLREETPRDFPVAFLDFASGTGRQFVLDPSLALQEIRQQLGTPAPRFDLALGMMRYKQGLGSQPSLYSGGIGLAMQVAAEIGNKAAGTIPGAQLPGAKLVINRLSKTVWKRVKDLPLGQFLSTQLGSEFALALHSRTSPEIGEDLLTYLTDDLQANLPVHFNRAIRAILLFDTYEAVGSNLQNSVQRRECEEWIRDLAASFDFALTAIAGQNKLTWEEADLGWGGRLEQHPVGGLAEADARRFLALSEIEDAQLQGAILRTAQEPEGGYHCLSLGLCCDIVAAGRRSGREPEPETFSFRPQEWRELADRFMRSLPSDTERRWIEQLAVTPLFDEAAARSAYSRERSTEQDTVWDALRTYSFVEPVLGRQGWFAIRAQMRWAVENQPGAQERMLRNHRLWRELWREASETAIDEKAALAWYHDYCLEPSSALPKWFELAEDARTAVPARMWEHFKLLGWWEPVGLLERPRLSPEEARALSALGVELWRASLGNRSANLQQAIACYEAALRVYTEAEFPQEWARVQNTLGLAWSDLPSGNGDGNLQQAIACYEAALRVLTETCFPRGWAITQSNLGNACGRLSGNRDVNLRRAIGYYEAALRVYTESDFPQDWARMQNNLGTVWSGLTSGNRDTNLLRAIGCYEAALRVLTETDFPREYKLVLENLRRAQSNL